MKIALNILIIFLVCLIQVSVLPQFSVFGGLPNLILIGAIIFIFLESETWALFWAVAGGITLDLASGSFFGVYTLGLLAIIWFLIYLNKRLIESTNLLLIVFLTLIASVVFDFWFLAISWASGKVTEILNFSQFIGADGLYNAAIILIIFPFIFGFWRNYFHRSEIKL